MNPRTRGALLLVSAIVLEVTGSLTMKAALAQPWLFAVTGLAYLGAFTLLGAVLRLGVPVGVAYGAWAAGGVSLTAVASTLVFGEPFTPRMGLGIVLIAVGVLCVELGGGQPHQSRAVVDL